MDEIVEIEDVKLVRSTPGAGLFEWDGEQFWVPWSLVDEGSVDRDGDVGTLCIPLWKARELGWDI